jgi:Tfp pilus assembly protein PilN
MKPLLNLASEPFRNRRLFWLFLTGLIFATALFGLNTLTQKRDLQTLVTSLEPQVKKLEEKAKGVEGIEFEGSTLSSVQNIALIAADDLILRKSFSWSQLLNDLERHIPYNVRVTRIAVDKVGKKGGNINTESADRPVMLSFEVVGKQATDVTQMIADLNHSARFTASPVSQKAVEETNEVMFQLEVEYRASSLSSTSAPVTQVAEGGKK